ncbi:PAS domain S-box protein [bacterium]|nr:PAS domain S-box protein [bacterium]
MTTQLTVLEKLYRFERETILPIRWVMVVIAVLLAVVNSQITILSDAAAALLVIFLAYTVLCTYLLLRVPNFIPVVRAFAYTTFALDLFFMAGLVFTTDGIHSNYHILFFLIVLHGTGVFERPVQTLVVYMGAIMLYLVIALAGSPFRDPFAATRLLVTLTQIWGVILLSWVLMKNLSQQNEELVTSLRDLRLSSEFNLSLLSSMSDGVIATNGAGQVVFMNESACRILGVAEDAVRYQDVYYAFPAMARIIEIARTRREVFTNHRVEFRRADGGKVEAIAAAQVIEGSIEEPGGQPGVVCVFKDVSEIRELEEGLIRTERLASVGEIAAGLAHEIGNPLGIIKSCAKYLQKSPKVAEELREDLEIIESEATRCEKIVQELLRLSSPGDFVDAPLTVNAVLEQSINLIQLRSEHEGLEVARTLPPYPIVIRGDEKQLASVFTNILLNAAQALDGRGRVEVELSERHKEDGSWAVIRIADNGPGIAREDIPRIFNPFFTRREGGTGLGLSIVWRIVERMGGRIEVESELGRGAAFTLYFPLVKGLKLAERRPASLTPTLVDLIVDDEGADYPSQS